MLMFGYIDCVPYLGSGEVINKIGGSLPYGIDNITIEYSGGNIEVNFDGKDIHEHWSFSRKTLDLHNRWINIVIDDNRFKYIDEQQNLIMGFNVSDDFIISISQKEVGFDKPKWEDAPEDAYMLLQEDYGEWFWHLRPGSWEPFVSAGYGEPNPNWKETLEFKP